MTKNISIELYARKRKFKTDTRKIATSTPAGKLAHEYFTILSMHDVNLAVQELMAKWDELNKMKKITNKE